MGDEQRLWIERPYKDDEMRELQSRSMFRWLSKHRRIKVWLFGGRTWSLILLKDEGDDRPSASGALIEVQTEMASCQHARSGLLGSLARDYPERNDATT